MNNILDIKPNIIIGENYEGELILSSWSGFQSRHGFYASIDTNEVSSGLVRVFVEGKEVDYVKVTTVEQVNAIKYLVDNSDIVRDALLTGLLNEIPELKEIYEDLIPEIHKIEDFRNCIGLGNIHLMSSDKDNFAYIGFELGCDWDEEHGVGVMMHKDRVIAIGQADTAFNSWVPFEDSRINESETKKWDEANSKLQLEKRASENKKPWWKFWQ